MPGGLGEGVRGLPSRELRAAASTHGNTYLNLTWTKTAILHFYIIIFPPSQNDIVAVQGNENKAECFLANTIISWPESHSDLIGMSLCVCLHVCALMGIPRGIIGTLGKIESPRFIACGLRADCWLPSEEWET